MPHECPGHVARRQTDLDSSGLGLTSVLTISLIHFPPPSFFQTVASPRVSDPLLLSSTSPGLWVQKTKNPWTLGWCGQRYLLRGAHLLSFPATASYQQGVLSATLLYEILLGKAAVYAVLVSVLVLMAVVRSRAGGRRVGGRR